MTLTYSEARQKVLFKAARDMRKIAAGVLDDVENETECGSPYTVQWAVSVAKKTAELANELEAKGHEECIAPQLAETLLARSRDDYGQSISDFERRVRAAGGRLWLPGAGDKMHPANDESKVYAR